LKRVIAKRLQDELAVRILEGNFGEGDTIVVDAKKDELVMTKANGSTRDPANLH
jgi:ATP-dependent Clp protease ATP-binding subunit ClpA